MRRALLVPFLLLALAAAAAAEPVAGGDEALLGPRLEFPGLVLRPPAGFSPLGVIGEETGALAPGAPGAPREVLLSLVRAPDATFTVTRIAAPFPGGSGSRDRLARAALDHVGEALGVELQLLWAETANGLLRAEGAAAEASPPAVARRGEVVELAARYRLAGRDRGILLAFLPVHDETLVLAWAGPADAVARSQPAFSAVLRQIETPGPPAPSPGAALWLLAAASMFGGGSIAAAMRRRSPPPTKRERR